MLLTVSAQIRCARPLTPRAIHHKDPVGRMSSFIGPLHSRQRDSVLRSGAGAHGKVPEASEDCLAKEVPLAMLKKYISALTFVVGMGSPAHAWEVTPLSRCFEAMERGAIVRSFSNEDWFSPVTRQYHLETEHIWGFYGAELFDLYYDTRSTGPSAAYCEVKQFYPGEGQPY